MNLAPKSFFPVSVAALGVLLVAGAHYLTLSGGPRLAPHLLVRSPTPSWRCAKEVCAVERAEIFRGSAYGSLRLVPRPHHDGVQITSPIAAGSLPDRLGLRRGDVLRSLNGVSFATPDMALQAYASLHTAQRLFLRIEREGQPLVLRYAVR